MRKKRKPVTSMIVWNDLKEKQSVVRRATQLFGRYGVSTYVRGLVADDLAKPAKSR